MLVYINKKFIIIDEKIILELIFLSLPFSFSKIKLHKGLRHYFGLKVRGQHTNSTGRRGKTVGVSRTKA